MKVLKSLGKNSLYSESTTEDFKWRNKVNRYAFLNSNSGYSTRIIYEDRQMHRRIKEES